MAKRHLLELGDRVGVGRLVPAPYTNITQHLLELAHTNITQDLLELGDRVGVSSLDDSVAGAGYRAPRV